jgi:glycine reductase complex component B subunit gamma
MVGVNRILVGNSVTCLVGNSRLTKEQEKALRRRMIIKALELLATPVEGPTVWDYQ